MPTNMDRLIALLTEKERIMEEMAGSLTEEQSRIIEMNAAAVTDSTRSKEEVTARLALVTAECRDLMGVVGSERGMESSGALTLLMTVASDAERKTLAPLQQRLLRLAEDLVRRQDLNRRLLVRSLALIERSISLFSRVLGGCDTYGAHGHVSTGAAGLSFLSREI